MFAVILLIFTSLLLAYANGANDNFKAVATLYGSSTLSYRASLILATAAQLLGSIACVFVAGALLRAFSGKGLVPDLVVTNQSFLIAVGLGAAMTVLLATRLGLPISTTHSLIGGLAGAGLFFAPEAFNWKGLGSTYFLPLLISPFIAVVLAGTLYPIASYFRRRLGVDEVTCVCIGKRVELVSITNDGAVLARSGLALSIDQVQNCHSRYDGSLFGISAARVNDSLHVLSGTALGFARGLNDTPKVLAILVAAKWSGIDMRISLITVALVMASGGVIHSMRIARTLGKRITEMNRGQGLIANLVGSALVIGASLIGKPVSTTHVSTGAIFGIGLWTGKARWRVVTEIILAWVATLPLAAILSFVAASMLNQ